MFEKSCLMNKTVIIVAGGSGSRMNAQIPKQFLLLKNEPVLMHSIKRFYSFDSKIRIIVALPEEHISYWETLCEQHGFGIQHTVVNGGESRFHSVRNALEKIDKDHLVGVHDGVRPLVSESTIQTCFDMASVMGNAVPVTDPVESVRKVHEGKSVALEREKLKMVQTPQVFKGEILIEAYRSIESSCFTDDASVVESAGNSIHLVEGNRENIKITTSLDLLIAEAIIENL